MTGVMANECDQALHIIRLIQVRLKGFHWTVRGQFAPRLVEFVRSVAHNHRWNGSLEQQLRRGKTDSAGPSDNQCYGLVDWLHRMTSFLSYGKGLNIPTQSTKMRRDDSRSIRCGGTNRLARLKWKTEAGARMVETICSAND
jgi:hypothetical protein